MTVALMLVVAAGVAAWVLAPLRAPAGGPAAGPQPEPPMIVRDPRGTQDGDPWPPTG